MEAGKERMSAMQRTANNLDFERQQLTNETTTTPPRLLTVTFRGQQTQAENRVAAPGVEKIVQDHHDLWL